MGVGGLSAPRGILPSVPPIRDRYSVFDARRNGAVDSEEWVKCPVFNCRYEVPVGLEDVARERHRGTHSAEVWASVLTDLRSSQDAALEACKRQVAELEDDIARAEQWIGEGE